MDNATIYLDRDSEVQPDVCLFRTGEQAHLIGDDYVEGAPKLVVKAAGIASSGRCVRTGSTDSGRAGDRTCAWIQMRAA